MFTQVVSVVLATPGMVIRQIAQGDGRRVLLFGSIYPWLPPAAPAGIASVPHSPPAIDWFHSRHAHRSQCLSGNATSLGQRCKIAQSRIKGPCWGIKKWQQDHSQDSWVSEHQDPVSAAPPQLCLHSRPGSYTRPQHDSQTKNPDPRGPLFGENTVPLAAFQCDKVPAEEMAFVMEGRTIFVVDQVPQVECQQIHSSTGCKTKLAAKDWSCKEVLTLDRPGLLVYRVSRCTNKGGCSLLAFDFPSGC